MSLSKIAKLLSNEGTFGSSLEKKVEDLIKTRDFYEEDSKKKGEEIEKLQRQISVLKAHVALSLELQKPDC